MAEPIPETLAGYIGKGNGWKSDVKRLLYFSLDGI